MWGINWPLSKFALHYTPPVLFAGVRTLIEDSFYSVRITEIQRVTLKKKLGIYTLFLLYLILYLRITNCRLQYMPAGLFSAIVFLQPVLLGIFSWIWLEESMYGLKIFGLILDLLA